MKNFRKVLALILVVATLFSFTAMASAVEYKDAAKISDDYSEAVDVLSAIGILNGYTDETFRPTQNITRAEMAKMVAVLSNAGDDVSDLYASANTFADVKGNWAISYIAYCNQTGIVQGRSATTFDPDANVTGIETAKMLLCVLGFDAEEQGYVGSNWKTNILRDAKNVGLLDNFADGFDVSKAISREETAQMFLNALRSNLVVGTISNNIVKISNSSRIEWKKGENTTLIDAEKYGWYNLYGNVVVSKDHLYSIYKGLKVEGVSDCYGRPGTLWTFTNNKTGKVTTIGFYVNAADRTYTTWADLATDYKSELAATGNYAYKFTYYVDGQQIAATTASGFANTYTGNGTLTEVFVDEIARQIVVTAKRTYFAKVTAVSAYYGTFTLSDVNGNTIGTFAQLSEKVSVGDYVLFYLCNGISPVHSPNKSGSLSLHDVEVVEPVTATVSYARSYDGDLNYSYFIAGETYSYNVNFGNMYNGLARGTASAVLDQATYNNKSVDIYTDAYGNAMYVTRHNNSLDVKVAFFEEKTGWAEFNGYYKVNGEKIPDWTYTADAAVYGDTAGTVELTNMAIDDVLFDNLDDRASHEGVGILAKYTVDGNGVFTKVAHADFVAAGAQLSKESRTILDGELYANSDTKFMIRTKDPASGDWTYTEVIGYQNLPATYIARSVNSQWYPNCTSIQYFANENELKLAEYVFIDAVYSPSYSEFLVMGEEYTAFWNGVWGIYRDDYTAYRALVDGVDSLVLIDKRVTLQTGYMYDFGLTYLGTAMTEDADKNGNKDLPLYVSAELKTPAAANTLQCAKFDIYVDSKGDVQVKVYDAFDSNNYDLMHGIDEVTVFHVRQADKYNKWQGYWTEVNQISTELLKDAQRIYIVTDNNGDVTAIYVVEL